MRVVNQFAVVAVVALTVACASVPVQNIAGAALDAITLTSSFVQQVQSESAKAAVLLPAYVPVNNKVQEAADAYAKAVQKAVPVIERAASRAVLLADLAPVVTAAKGVIGAWAGQVAPANIGQILTSLSNEIVVLQKGGQ